MKFHEKYIKENFPGRSVNLGWSVDYVFGEITSKIYGNDHEEPMIVTTSMEPPFKTIEELY